MIDHCQSKTAAPLQEPASNRLRTFNALRRASGFGSSVGSEHYFGIKDTDNGVKVAVAKCGEEGLDGLSLLASRHVRITGAGPDPSSRPARKLARCAWRSADDRANLFEGKFEHVVQHESDSFGRLQLLKDDHKRESDGLRQPMFGLGINGSDLLLDQRGVLRLQRIFSARLPRSQNIKTDARNERRKPPAEILDVTNVCPAEAKPAFLNGILGVSKRAEHSEGDRL
jgi:hypothetical protein